MANLLARQTYREPAANLVEVKPKPIYGLIRADSHRHSIPGWWRSLFIRRNSLYRCECGDVFVHNAPGSVTSHWDPARISDWVKAGGAE